MKVITICFLVLFSAVAFGQDMTIEETIRSIVKEEFEAIGYKPSPVCGPVVLSDVIQALEYALDNRQLLITHDDPLTATESDKEQYWSILSKSKQDLEFINDVLTKLKEVEE